MRFPSQSPSISHVARGFAFMALALLLFGLGGACEDKHVGRPCELGTMPLGGSSGQISTISSPALECPSRICLLPGATKDPMGTGPLCTADCEENQDCEDGEKGNPNDPNDHRCVGGFVCGYPTTVGSFKCQRMCMCTDFVDPKVVTVRPSTCGS